MLIVLVDSFGRKVNNDDKIILMQVPAEKSPTDYHDTIDESTDIFEGTKFKRLFLTFSLCLTQNHILNTLFPAILDENVASGVNSFANEALPMERELLVIHRCNVKCDLLNHFVDDTNLHKVVDVKMIDPSGVEEKGEGVGVVRDAFSRSFGMMCIYNSYMLGEDERVPSIRHDVSREKWQAIVRILLKGYTQERYFPIKISKVFLCSCFFGEETVTRDMYFDSFMKYVSKTEAHLIERILSDSLCLGDEEVVDFLSAFECKRLVTKENFRDVIIEIAHKELVQKPRY